MREVLAKSVEETVKVAHEWTLALLDAHDETVSMQEHAVVVGLSGNLGSGKTRFVQAVAEELGIKETVTSPTFVILKKYEITNEKFSAHFKHLIHIDAYRLENANELQAIGFAELVKDKANLIFIEWPERVIEVLPKFTTLTRFEFVDENTRKIEFTF